MHNQIALGNTPNVATLFHQEQNVSRHMKSAHEAHRLPTLIQESI